MSITGLQGFQGERLEVLILATTPKPRRLNINGQDVPFQWRDQVLLGEVEFEPAPPPPQLDANRPWEDAPEPPGGSRTVQSQKIATLLSQERFRSGIYELDMLCDFSRGGLLVGADAEGGKGLVATVMLSWFSPLDGGLAYWGCVFTTWRRPACGSTKPSVAGS